MKYDNLNNGARVPITHGELVLIPIDEMPKGKTTVSKKEILAHSETGHHHVLEAKTPFTLVENDTQKAVEIAKLAKLWHNKTHNKHETRVVAPGAYIINKKTEYHPFKKIRQRIFD